MTHGSLFTGIGGFDLAAEWAGIETIWNCEINEFNRNELKRLFPKTHQYDDVRKVQSPEPVDIISGGFPCQNISIAASRNRTGIDGDKSGLWIEQLRIVDQIKPKYVILENSSDLKNKGLDTILQEFARIGYNAEWQTLYGYQFGIPQRRRRLYIILYASSIGDRMEEGQVFSGWNKPVYPAWRSAESKIYGVVDVIPDRVDKHRALGNAVQPFICYYLFECIKDHYKKYLKTFKG